MRIPFEMPTMELPSLPSNSNKTLKKAVNRIEVIKLIEKKEENKVSM
jgi:hypothetical protein